jgi:hypothetical protein
MHRLLLVGAALAGCVDAPHLAVESQEAQLYCDEYLCTGNGTTVIGLPFGELHEGNVAVSGFKILQTLAPDGDAAWFEITGPWPRILTDDGWLSGAQMIGTKFLLETPHAFPNNQLWLEIMDYEQIPYFDGLPGPRIAGFDIRYTYQDPAQWPNPTVAANLCPQEAVDEQGIASTLVMMSQGDRFSDDASIIATGDEVGGYFNISCAGSVIAKLVRIRHAVAAHDGTHKTKLDQRKAALRMFTAKYCKEGPLYTMTDQPLTWEDYAPWTKPIASTPEAIWTADGAHCLVKPRYADPEDIACDLDPCTEADLRNWRAHGWLQSRIPK